MGDHTSQRKTISPTTTEFESSTLRFDNPLLYRLSYEARRKQAADGIVNQ